MLDPRLEHLIGQVLLIRAEKLTEDTSLFHDCGVAGMDGENFMEAFAREFNVDLSSVDFVTYSGEELAFNPFLWLWDGLTGKGWDPGRDIPRVPLRHWQEVAKAGVWFRPDEVRENAERK